MRGMGGVYALQVLGALTIGCAAGYVAPERQPAMTNLSAGVTSVHLLRVDDDCQLLVTLKSGKQVRPALKGAICDEASGLIQAAQLAEQQRQQQRQAPASNPETQP